MTKRYSYLYVFALSIYALTATGQGLTNHQIDSVVTRSMRLTPHAGVAVVVVQNGKVIHSKGYGFANVNTGEKVNEHTRFAIASNSKAFTAATLAILVDEGKIKWTDKVVDHIPAFKMYNPYVTANFTILDLLTHRSGLGLGAGDLMFFPDGGNFTMTDVLKSFQHQTPISDFRTKYDYDNLLYIVAGEIVARVSGMSWSAFVESRIMAPLGMVESAGTVQRLKSTKNLANPHHVVDGKPHALEAMDIEIGAAAGGIYASVSDLSKWLLLHLNEGMVDSVQLISKINHAEMWKPHTPIGFHVKSQPPYNNHFTAYGLGWQLNDQNGHVVVSHTGGLPGMLSKTTLIPDLNLGIVVLTNCDPGGYGFLTISGVIADAFSNIEGRDWLELGKNAIERRQSVDDDVVGKVWDQVKLMEGKAVDTAAFVGKYTDNWFGNMEVSIKNGRIWIRSIRSPKLTGQMFFYQANSFAIKWEYRDMDCDAFAMFELDEHGKAIGFKMKGISPNIDFSFDFQDLNMRRTAP